MTKNSEQHEKSEIEEITIETVESTIEDLKNRHVLAHFRIAVEGMAGFFDPDQGFIKDNDETNAKDVLDYFVACLESNDPKAIKGLLFAEDRNAICEALQPDTPTRKIIEGYYQIGPETRWCEAEIKIVDLQSYTRPEFPTALELERIAVAVNKTT